MQKIYKTISTIFNPLVVPTIGIIAYLIFAPTLCDYNQKLKLIGLVFLATYIIPILSIILFKSIGAIKDFKLQTINERKQPVLVMIILCYIFGKTFHEMTVTYDIGCLFLGITLALIITYIFLFFKIKSSLHLVYMSSILGFFLRLQDFYGLQLVPFICILIILCGFVGSSRLHLKAHKPIEIYLSFFTGLGTQLVIYWVI